MVMSWARASDIECHSLTRSTGVNELPVAIEATATDWTEAPFVPSAEDDKPTDKPDEKAHGYFPIFPFSLGSRQPELRFHAPAHSTLSTSPLLSFSVQET